MSILDTAKEQVAKTEAQVEVKADELIAKFQAQKRTGRIIAFIVVAIISLVTLAYTLG